MAKEKKKKKEVVVQTPDEKFTQLITLKEATKCILGIEDKYKIYVRLTKEFEEFGKTDVAKTVKGADQCETLSQECREMAEKLDQERPKDVVEESQTVTTTIRAHEEERAKKLGVEIKESKGKGKWIALGVALLAVFIFVALKIPVTRYAIANAESGLGLHKLAMNSFTYLENYKDSATRLQEVTYDYAVDMKEKSHLGRARKKFGKLAKQNYKDSGAQKLAVEKISLSKAKVGKTVIFGKTTWLVIDKKDTSICLAKFSAINDVPYNDTADNSTWETCSLRSYLNKKFLNEMFIAEEQAVIQDTKITNLDNATYKTDGGNDTIDKIFILNENELVQYKTALKGKLKTLRLRTPGRDQLSTTFVSDLEQNVDYGFPANQNGACIRPVLWVDFQ